MAHPPLRPHLLPSRNDGAGNHYCLDLSRASADEAPVVFWEHGHEDGPDQLPEEYAATFTAWLEEELTLLREG